MKFAFIKEHRVFWPVVVMCRVLRSAAAVFSPGSNGRQSPRSLRRQELLEKIRRRHQENRELYGSPRVHRALLVRWPGRQSQYRGQADAAREDQGQEQAEVRAPHHRQPHEQPVARNLLDRDFAAAAPDRKWLADITYVPTGEGWLYVAAVLDCFSRKIVGWSMADHMETDLVSVPWRWHCSKGRQPAICSTTATGACSTPAMTISTCWPAAGSL